MLVSVECPRSLKRGDSTPAYMVLTVRKISEAARWYYKLSNSTSAPPITGADQFLHVKSPDSCIPLSCRSIPNPIDHGLLATATG